MKNYVKFEPVITNNVEYVRLDFYLNNYQKRINIGDYIPKDAYLRANLYLKNNVDELTVFTFNGVNIGYRRSSVNDTAFNINQIYNYDSPQEVNITIDEYIRFEDIVQPYPAFYEFTDENRNLVTWGSKIKVGSTITRIKAFANSNLLKDLYNISYPKLNGVTSAGSKYIVERQMVFTCTATYLLDDNEPKCILSPRLLRIPNSSYKILGHIPDISGHGNHGKINNSAYAGMSGANGYVENFTTWGVYNGAILTDNTIKTNSNFNPANSWVAYKSANTILNSFSVNITGIPEGGILNFRVNADTFIELSNGRNDLSFDNILITVSSGFRITKGANLDWSNLVIQQIGEYEGSFCLDGVNDFVTIPTTVGGKQVLMKVNWSSLNSISYDQRASSNVNIFAIYTSEESGAIAYNARNNGQTYIDGILNTSIMASQLKDITHNITITNNNVTNANSISPRIGCSNTNNSLFTKEFFYDFMLFDNISTDDKIKELNEYVGIEGNTE